MSEEVEWESSSAWRATESKKPVSRAWDHRPTMSLIHFCMESATPTASCKISSRILCKGRSFFSPLRLSLKSMNHSAFRSHQEGPAFDYGELEEAIVLQGVKIRNDEAEAPRMLFKFLLILLLFFFPLVTSHLRERQIEKERVEKVFMKISRIQSETRRVFPFQTLQ